MCGAGIGGGVEGNLGPYRANAKYRPIWEPGYILFQRSRDLARIGLASAAAEGFVSAPRLPVLFGRRHRKALERA